MELFKLRILAADKIFFEGMSSSVIIPIDDGKYGILAHHQNMISSVVPGKLTFVTEDGKRHICAISNGFVKVEENEVLVLAEDIESPEDIDIKRAQTEADIAKEIILHKKSVSDFKSAQAQLARAINRIRVKNDSDNIKS